MSQTVVAHAIRGYLAPTETFVGNQVTMLRNHRPIVVAHHRSPNREFDIDDLYFINEQHDGIRRKLDDIAYATLRAFSPVDIDAAECWVRQYRPALWHFHFAVDAAFFLPLYRKLCIPAVVSLYGYDVSSFPHKLGGIGRKYIARMFKEMDCFLAMSDDMKRDAMALGAPEEKVIVHYHGINAQRFRFEERMYYKKDQFTVLCVGSLDPKKGQHHLLHAVAELRRQRPDINAKVVLVGTGSLREELDQIIEREDLAGRVHMAGYVQHLNPAFLEFYRNADVFVHFSTTQPGNDKEGIPGTIVEAMASGLPVIATKHAGIPEAITDGMQGILLEESDVAGIAKSLVKLHDCEDMRARLGRAAARRALNDLDIRTKMSHLEKIYDSIAQKYLLD
jgi:colanic acid/amylovoran biosynthesis glycosyltransferase